MSVSTRDPCPRARQSRNVFATREGLQNYLLPMDHQQTTTYLQAGLRGVRLLRLARGIAARLATSLATSLACAILEEAHSEISTKSYPCRLPLR